LRRRGRDECEKDHSDSSRDRVTSRLSARAKKRRQLSLRFFA
jgi:hypothetical protein